jgi:hypothetical protein
VASELSLKRRIGDWALLVPIALLVLTAGVGALVLLVALDLNTLSSAVKPGGVVEWAIWVAWVIPFAWLSDRIITLWRQASHWVRRRACSKWPDATRGQCPPCQ